MCFDVRNICFDERIWARKVTISIDFGSKAIKKYYLHSGLSRALQPFANAVARRRITNGEAIAFVDACWFCAVVQSFVPTRKMIYVF